MKFFVNFFILVLILSAIQMYVEAEIFNCEYSEGTWFNMDKRVYYCDVKNREIFPNGVRIKIDGASGEHENGYNNSHVKGLMIYRASNMNFFPSNIENVFPNLIFIDVFNSKLTQITNEDLKPFPKLEALYLHKTLIEFIPENLLIYNHDLEVIWLDENKIQHIDKNAFSNLKKLRILQLGDNTCKSLVNTFTKNDALNLVKRIEQGICQSNITTTTTTENPLNLLKQEIEELKKEIENLKAENQKCTTINESLN